MDGAVGSGEQQQDNYMIDIQQLVAHGLLRGLATGGLYRLAVLHDNRCAIFHGGRCDCTPSFTLERVA